MSVVEVPVFKVAVGFGKVVFKLAVRFPEPASDIELDANPDSPKRTE